MSIVGIKNKAAKMGVLPLAPKNGEAISLILDSTGLRFNTASNWYATKYNKVCKNKPWQKMHISIDPEMNIHNVEITDCYTADIEMLGSLIPENISADSNW